MKQFECKNGCSGEKGFYFHGNRYSYGIADINGNILDGQDEEFIDVIYYRCLECDGGWDVGFMEEEIYL